MDNILLRKGLDRLDIFGTILKMDVVVLEVVGKEGEFWEGGGCRLQGG